MKYLCAAVLAFAALVGVAHAEPPSQPSIKPGIDVTPIPDQGVIVTPTVNGNLPLGGGANLQGTITVPVVVPTQGPPQVAPPTFNLRLTIPLGGRR